MVKDADGTERFESASSVTFSDGSMEADLPMQQLSEMFNINHFIIFLHRDKKDKGRDISFIRD